MMSLAKEKLTQARTNLVLDQPFFGSLVLRLQLIETKACKHMATDGVSIIYNPDFVNSLTIPQLQGLLCHEVMHCSNGHPWRRGARDHKRWNEACDYAINPIIRGAGMQLPPGGLEDKQYDGMPAEQVYSRLPIPPESGSGGDQGGDAGGDNQQQGEGSGGSGDGQPDDQQQGDDDGDQESEQQGDDEGDGQGEGEGDQDGEAPGAVRDAPDPQKAAEQEADWRVATAQAAQAAKAQGKLPADLERFVEEALRPKVDWKAVLRRFIQETARCDYSWRQPSSRYIASGIYMPHLRSESMPPVVIAVDTSGSVDDVTLAKFAAEINAIADETKPERIHVIYCDARVHRIDEFSAGEAIIMKPQGGGGTDFRPVFDHIEREQIEAACLIYLTDMYGTFPDVEPEFPVLWASTTRDIEGPIGETLYIEPEVQS